MGSVSHSRSLHVEVACTMARGERKWRLICRASAKASVAPSEKSVPTTIWDLKSLKRTIKATLLPKGDVIPLRQAVVDAAKVSKAIAIPPVACGKVIAVVMVSGSYESGMAGAFSYTQQPRRSASEWVGGKDNKPRGWGILLQRQRRILCSVLLKLPVKGFPIQAEQFRCARFVTARLPQDLKDVHLLQLPKGQMTARG